MKNAIEMGIAVPCLMASLSYLEMLRAGSLPSNLIQAQRDFFGAHGYERVDVEGTHHSKWDEA
jgi:6-phosphogluconate dehydrogenase